MIVMNNELSVVKFDYSALDMETSNFLQAKELKLRNLAGNFYTELGKELKEAQDRLAKNRYGCFWNWLESIGIKKDTANRFIQRYNLIIANCDDRELIEELPLSLSYEIAKPSTLQDLKTAVLSGDITTHKQYKELLKERDEARQKAMEFRNKVTELENRPPEIKEKFVNPLDYDTLKSTLEQLQKDAKYKTDKIINLENKVKLYEKDSTEYTNLKKQIDFLRREKSDISRQIDSATELAGLTVKLHTILKSELAPIKFGRHMEQLEKGDVALKNLTEIIEMVEGWTREMREYLPNKNIINVEVVK